MSKSLEARNFIATPADISAITISYTEALEFQSSARGNYLKALVATTQHELGSPPRLRTVRGGSVSDEDRQVQLVALEAVHDRFYKAVADALELEVPSREERHRRGTFARTAVSTVRAWIRGGGDVRTLAAAGVTKGSLRRESKRSRRARPVAQRAERIAARVIATALDVAKQDKEAGRELLGAIISRLAAELEEQGVEPTSKIETATKQRRPFRTKGGTFWPVGTREGSEASRLQ